jgi:hypothetical protein
MELSLSEYSQRVRSHEVEGKFRNQALTQQPT